LCEIEQPLRPIPLHEWKWKNYPDAWLHYFQYQLLLERNQHWQPYLVFVQPNLYRLKIGRNWIHEVREIDPEIESRLGELDRWFEIHQGWRHYRRLKGHSQSYRWCNGEKNRQRFLTEEHRREMHRAVLDFPEVDPTASIRRPRTSPRPPFSNHPGVAQCRGNELRPRPVQVQVLPPGPWNANRPSVPGFPAKEYVPHPRDGVQVLRVPPFSGRDRSSGRSGESLANDKADVRRSGSHRLYIPIPFARTARRIRPCLRFFKGPEA
jgi:hypothetical protein